jgi:hypothetical protein
MFSFIIIVERLRSPALALPRRLYASSPQAGTAFRAGDRFGPRGARRPRACGTWLPPEYPMGFFQSPLWYSTTAVWLAPARSQFEGLTAFEIPACAFENGRRAGHSPRSEHGGNRIAACIGIGTSLSHRNMADACLVRGHVGCNAEVERLSNFRLAEAQQACRRRPCSPYPSPSRGQNRLLIDRIAHAAEDFVCGQGSSDRVPGVTHGVDDQRLRLMDDFTGQIFVPHRGGIPAQLFDQCRHGTRVMEFRGRASYLMRQRCLCATREVATPSNVKDSLSLRDAVCRIEL